jgi:hypothetical protein
LGGNKPGTCYVPSTHATIQEAVDDDSCNEIRVSSGEWAGALVNRQVDIMGTGNAVINGGPAHGSGLIQGFRFLEGSDGSSISHLIFTGTDLSIMNGGAVDGVTIEHNTFNNSVQAVSNWIGADWVISKNTITDLRTLCGGGIGIFVGDYTGNNKTSGNVISHNTISGTLHVSDGDCGGYNGSGIVLYSDFRWESPGGDIFDNSVVHNRISLQSDTPGTVDVVAFEMTDTRDDESLGPALYDNAIGFNDFRGTTIQIELTPDNLDAFNDISRNLGDNRGHGLHPLIFGPGGN